MREDFSQDLFKALSKAIETAQSKADQEAQNAAHQEVQGTAAQVATNAQPPLSLASLGTDSSPTHPASKFESIHQLLNQQRLALHNQSLADDLILKRKYGFWAFFLLAAQLMVMNAVFIGVGLRHLEFSNDVLHMYLGGTLLEVFGIVFIVVRYLFKPAPLESKGTSR
jgi:hypothetical protein